MEKIKKKVVKKDNQKVDFNHTKIIDAILNASTNTKTPLPFKKVQIIVNDIVNDIKKIKDNDIESKKIYELILENLRKNEHHSIAKKIEDFSANREKNRFRKTKLMGSIRKIAIETDRENANVGNNFSAKLLKIASEANK
jgi:ribonucleoside-triphosphate reductase